MIRLAIRMLCISNSLVPGRFGSNFESTQLKSIIDIFSSSCEVALRWMSQDLADYKSILVQVITWCRKATSHYLSQCWIRCLSLYDVTRPHWIKKWINRAVFAITSFVYICYSGVKSIFLKCLLYFLRCVQNVQIWFIEFQAWSFEISERFV